jgi:hemolysin III
MTGFAVVVYGVTAVLVFGVSAVYHRWGWPSRHRSWWQRADHSTIFLFIAGTATPVTVVAVDAPWSWLVLTALWAGALFGVVRVWRRGVRSHLGPLYAGLGWAGVLVSAQFLSVAGGTAFTLLVVGGLCYTLGALASFRQRPNPWPRTFGYHEVFHACTVVAAVCQFLAIVIALPGPVVA